MVDTARRASASGNVEGVRDRILSTAADLFYQQGVRAVGVDLIVERSGVAKTSLYRHFSTKDELIAAFLDKENDGYWASWDQISKRHAGDPAAELRAQLEAIARHIVSPGYRGCPFLNVAIEFPARDHPARSVAMKHKSELRQRLFRLVDPLAARNAEELTDDIMLLIDGAYVDGDLLGCKGPSRNLPRAAFALLGAPAEAGR
jgi:AcrR family transcriptional regulator